MRGDSNRTQIKRIKAHKHTSSAQMGAKASVIRNNATAKRMICWCVFDHAVSGWRTPIRAGI